MAISVMSPYYIVQNVVEEHIISYYIAPEEAYEKTFSKNKKLVLLFTSLQSASRVADSTDAEVRVLYNKEHLKEFGRE